MVTVTVMPNKKQRQAQSKRDKSKAMVVAKARTVRTQPQSRSLNFDITKHMSNVASQYFATVLAPCAGNARIPDMNCMPTYLLTLEDEFTCTVNAGFVTGASVTLNSLNVTGTSGPCFSTEFSGSTDASISYNAAIPLTGAAAATAAAGASRVVSACLDIIYIGSDLNNSGMLVGASGWSYESSWTSTQAFAATRSNATVRIADGMTVTYRPGDSTSFDFSPTGVAKRYGYLAIHASGLSSGASFRCKVRVNYECLPATDGTDLTTSAVRSPVDVVGFSNAVSASQGFKPIASADVQNSLTSRMSAAFDAAKTYGPALIATARAAYRTANAFL